MPLTHHWPPILPFGSRGHAVDSALTHPPCCTFGPGVMPLIHHYSSTLLCRPRMSRYTQMLRDIADRYDVTLIFDETITGFCKTGRMFAAQSYGVTPDVIVCGKGLSNGTMPLSAMIASSKMAGVFQDSNDPDKMFA